MASATQRDNALVWLFRDTFAMTKRNIVKKFRVPQILVFTLIQPVLFVFLFRYVFGGAIKISGQDYVDYLMPGIFVQTATFGMISTAIGLAEDKGSGLIERLKSLPMTRSAVLSGRVFADTLFTVLVTLVMLCIGYAVGFDSHTNPWMVTLGVVMLVSFGFGMAWIFAVIGLSVANSEAAQAAAFPLIAPLAFASNLFVDPATMPGWLQAWARNQPVSATANAVRACMLGGPTLSKVLIALGWTLGITLVVAPAAVRRYRRI